jgi:hypothetical protein
MKTLDDAVIELNGVWPSKSDLRVYMVEYASPKVWSAGSQVANWLFTKEQFTQRAKELGFINGYRWGVEYPTNGKKPDLENDVVVEINNKSGRDYVGYWRWSSIESFRITDERYKPADTSYLDKPESSLDNEPNCGDNEVGLSIAIADAMNAAVSCGQVEIAKRLQEINKDVLAEANKRKAEAEKKRVVGAAIIAGSTASHEAAQSRKQFVEMLYDKGYLRLPTEKN